MKTFAWLTLFGSLLLTSCNHFSLEVTHRRYRPGFYVDFTGKKNAEHQASPVGKTVRRENAEHAAEQANAVKEKKENAAEHSALAVSKKQAAPEVNHRNETHVHAEKPFTASRSVKPERAPDTFRKAEIKKSRSLFPIAGTAGLLAMGLFFSSRKRLSKVSRWSSRNPVLSRCFQVAGHAFLVFGGFMAGSVLYRHDIVASPMATGIFTSVFLGASALYPLRKKGMPVFANEFTKFKTFDLAIILSGLMMSASVGNRVAAERLTASTEKIIPLTQPKQFFEKISAAADKIDAQYFSSDARSLPKNPSAEQVTLMVLTIIAFVLCVIGVALLTCYLACSGNTGLAITALLGGLALFIFLLILAVKGINSMNKGEPEPSPSTPQ